MHRSHWRRWPARASGDSTHCPSAQVTIIGNEDPAAPGTSVEVDDFDAVHGRAAERFSVTWIGRFASPPEGVAVRRAGGRGTGSRQRGG